MPSLLPPPPPPPPPPKTVHHLAIGNHLQKSPYFTRVIMNKIQEDCSMSGSVVANIESVCSSFGAEAMTRLLWRRPSTAMHLQEAHKQTNKQTNKIYSDEMTPQMRTGLYQQGCWLTLTSSTTYTTRTTIDLRPLMV